MQETLLTVRYFERGLSKRHEKVTLFFLLNPVPFNGQNYKKQKDPGTSHQPFFRLQNKFRKIPLLIVWWCNIKRLLSCSKITSANLCKPIHDVKSSTPSYTSESGKCGKKVKKLQKLIITSQDLKELFRWNEKQFSQFLKCYHLVKK